MESSPLRRTSSFPRSSPAVRPRRLGGAPDSSSKRVGLADRAGHLPSALSGGQRHGRHRPRAGQLAHRHIRRRAHGNLDSAATLEVLRLFEALHEDGLTLVVVTHDAQIASSADRLVSMQDGAFISETTLTGPPPTAADLAGLEG